MDMTASSTSRKATEDEDATITSLVLAKTTDNGGQSELSK